MAWFNRSKSSEENNGGDEYAAPEIQPDKASKWFKQAQTAADTRNYEYAITCFLSGIKFNPSKMEAHQTLLEVAGLYRSMGGKSASGKELREILGEKRPVDKLAATELAWVRDALNAGLCLKFVEQAAELGLSEVAFWAADMGARMVLRAKKPSKNQLIGFIDVFERIGASHKSVEYGEIALRMDPSDTNLVSRLRNLSAQATMEKGRYEEGIGEEGGFRNSVKNIDAQSAQSEDEALAIGEEAEKRRIERAREQWEEEPDNQGNIAKLADLLRKEGSSESEKEAIRVLLDGYKKTGQFRFRVTAFDIKLAQERKKLRALKEKANASGDKEDLDKVKDATKTLKEHEANEFRERIKNYPTDLRLRYDLGRIMFELGEYDDAIPELQAASDDARYRAVTTHLIGLCFLRQDWLEEAVESLRQAVELYEIKDDNEHLGMRYDLMEALEHLAKEHDDLDAAEEAFSIARGITMKQLNFRDIKKYRDTLRDLVKSFKNK